MRRSERPLNIPFLKSVTLYLKKRGWIRRDRFLSFFFSPSIYPESPFGFTPKPLRLITSADDRHTGSDKRELDSKLSRNLSVPHVHVLLEISRAIPDFLKARLFQRANIHPGHLPCSFFRRIPSPHMRHLPIGATCWLSISFTCGQSASGVIHSAVPLRLNN